MLTLATPLIVTPGTVFPFVVGKALFARTVIEITFACWLILIIYSREHRPAKSWILLALGGWLLVSLLAGFNGVSLTRSLWSTYERMHGIVDLAHWVGFTLVAASVFRTLVDWRRLFTVNQAVSVLVSALGLSQYLGGYDFLLPSNTDRLASSLGNPTYMGAYTAISVMIGVGLLLHSFASPRRPEDGERPVEPTDRSRAERRRWSRLARESGADYLLWLRALWALSILLNLWALWLTGARAGIVALVVGAVAFAFGYLIWGRRRAIRLAAVGILAAVILAIDLIMLVIVSPLFYPLQQSSPTLARLASINLETESVHNRIVAVKTGLRAYQDLPILGWGPENYIIAWGRHFDALTDPGITEQYDQAHNKVIEELATKGTVGLLAYLLVWLAMAAAMIRSARRREDFEQLFIIVLGATLVTYFVQNLALFDTPTTLMLFTMLAAFAVSEERRWRNRAPDREAQEATEERRSAGWRRWREALAVSRLPGIPVVKAALALSIVALVIAALLIYTVPPYQGARTALQAVNSSESWDDQAGYFNRAAEQFPGLAGQLRLFLIIQASQQFPSLPEEKVEPAVALIAEAGQQGLQVEPYNWQLRQELARFYQAAATWGALNDAYLNIALEHMDAARQLAPRVRSVIRAGSKLESVGQEEEAEGSR